MINPSSLSPEPKLMAQQLARSFSHAWNRLTMPAATIRDYERRQQARLLSSLLLALILAITLILMIRTIGGVLWQDFTTLAAGGAIAILIAIYSLSRTRHYIASATLTVAALFALVHTAPLWANRMDHALFYATLPILLSSILLSLPAMLAVAGISLGNMLLLVLISPRGIDIYLAPFSHTLITTAIMVTFIYHRNRIERERTAELQAVNAALQAKIGEQKQAVGALRASEERFALAVRGSNDGIWDWDLVNHTLYWSPRLIELHGYDPNDLDVSFDKFESQLHPDDEERVMAAIEAHLKDRVPYDVEERLRCKSGEYRWFRARGQAIWDETGRPLRMVGATTDITERKQVEIALRQSEARFATVFYASPTAIVLSVPETGRFLDANDSYLRLVGYPREEIIDRTSLELGIWANPVERARLVEAVREHGSIHDTEITVRQKSGQIRHALTSAELIDLDSEPCLIGMLHDITERKQAEEALRRSEEKYRLVVESSLQGIAIFQNHRIVFVNPAICQIAGYSAAELTSFSAEQILATVHPEDRAVAIERSRARGQGKLVSPHYEYRIVRPDGTVRCIETFTRPMVYENEPGSLSISLDITERKQAEAALRDSEARYRSLFEDAPISLWEEDFSTTKESIDELRSQGVADFRAYFESHPEVVAHCLTMVKIIDVNKATLELYEASSKEEFFEELSQFFDQKSYEVFKEELIAIAQGNTRIEFENVNYTLKGNRKEMVFTWFVCPGYEETFSRVLVAIIDVTERKRLEEQLRQAQKLEAIGRLAGGIAHDFNNILTVIKGYTGLLLQDLDAHNPLTADIGQIEKSAERAAALTRQLLAFSRKQVLQSAVLDFNAIVSNMDKMLQRLIGEDIILTTLLDPALGQIKADPGQIEQVILNLAANARDAMPQGGKLTIETKNIYLDKRYARQHLDVKVGPYIMLAMSDTGSGMDQETRSHMFEPFFTTKEQGKGTGLGLATVHGIVTQSGGHIGVSSEPGQGTTFKVYLPRVEGDASSAKPKLQRPLPPKRGSETILLVEDEALVREFARRTLLNEGYLVLEASYGEEAIRVAGQHHGLIDLLVTDIVMPGGMSGCQLAERLAPLHQEMKVLYMSGYTDDALIRHGVFEADTAFLQKPFSPDHLAGKVREVLDMHASTQI